MAEILYGYVDGLAARYDERGAWVLNEGWTKWNRMNTHDDAIREITKDYYDERFPNIPPLPPEAFKIYPIEHDERVIRTDTAHRRCS